MKKQLLFTLPILALLVGLGIKNINCCKLSTNKAQIAKAFEKDLNEQDDAGILGAAEYLFNIKKNNTTQKIDIKDILTARTQAKKLTANNQKANTLNWEFLGPNDIGGRVRTLLIDKDNSDKLWTGGVSGGLFYSTDAGNNWIEYPGNTSLPALSINTIAQADNGDIYIGTGEGFYPYYGFSGGGTPGEGIYKMKQDGSDLKHLTATIPSNDNNNSLAWAAVNKILINPTNNNIVYALLGGYSTGSNTTATGLMVSKDAGETWEKASGVDSNSFPGYDIATTSNGTIFAAISSKFYKSTDGINFTKISGTGAAFPDVSGRKVICISPQDENYMYAAIIKNNECLNKVIKSTDGGNNWEEIGVGSEYMDPTKQLGDADSGCQGGYDLAIAIDPTNKDKIFLAGIFLWKWTLNEGWTNIDDGTNYDDPAEQHGIHADKHFITFDKKSTNIMYITCDGGVFKSYDAQSNEPKFIDRNKNLNITQFYSVAAQYDGRAAGGAQDNGTIYNSINSDSKWASVNNYGGDGTGMAISKNNPLIMFAAQPNGQLVRSTNGGVSYTGALDENTDCLPKDAQGNCKGDNLVDDNANFNTIFYLWENATDYYTAKNINDPQIPAVSKYRLFIGSGTAVYMSVNALNASQSVEWKKIATVTSAVTCITTTLDGEIAFVGLQNGKVLRITNLDANVTSTKLTTVENNRFVLGLATDKFYNNNVLIVTLGNYGEDTYVYKSINANAANPTYQSIQANLPKMPVYAAVISFADNTDNTFFVGTEMGIWKGEFDGSNYNWTQESKNLGNVPVYALTEELKDDLTTYPNIYETDCYVMYAGTHGRGIFRCTDLSSCNTSLPIYSPNAINNINSNDVSMIISPNPVTDNTTINVNFNKTVQKASLTVFDITGKLINIYTLNNSKGEQKIPFIKNNLLQGTYIAILNADNQKISKKIIVK